MFKKTLCGLAVATTAVGFVAWTAMAVPQIDAKKKSLTAQADEIVDPNLNVAASSGPCGGFRPCSYIETFEAGWVIGNSVVGQPALNPNLFERWDTGCGGTTASTASTANPFAGSNHVRLALDAAKNPDGNAAGACVVAARVPSSANAAAFPVNVNVTTVSQELAMAGGTGDYNVQPQAPGEGFLTTRSLFLYYGLIIHLDDVGAGLTFVSGGSWDTSGAYQNFTISFDPCTPEIRYSYGGVEVYNTTTAGSVDPIFGGSTVQQVLYYHDNFSGSQMDIDNVRIDRAAGPCPTTCGADGIEGPNEECEILAEGGDGACPGRCVAPGQTGPGGELECTCVRACPDPCNACPIVNDSEMGELTTGGWYTFTASAPAYAFDSCGAAGYDSRISIWEGADCDNIANTLINDDCDDNSFGFGLNADPLAPCYAIGGIASPYNSCTCIATTVGTQYWVWDDRVAAAGAGVEQVLHASKRLTCGAEWANGACCDQLTGECTDDVAEGACSGLVNIWTENKSCGTPEAGECNQIYGSCCDTLDGGCTGPVLASECTGAERQFNLGQSCTPSSCPPATGACCVFDDTNISGKNCTDGVTRIGCADVSGDWYRDQTCEQVNCQNAIPTVSEWGLVIIALLLLSGAKVFFGRREALA